MGLGFWVQGFGFRVFPMNMVSYGKYVGFRRDGCLDLALQKSEMMLVHPTP